MRPDARTGVQSLEQHLAEHRDRGQRVVQLVGHDRGDLSQHGQAFLVRLLLGLAKAHGDITADEDLTRNGLSGSGEDGPVDLVDAGIDGDRATLDIVLKVADTREAVFRGAIALAAILARTLSDGLRERVDHRTRGDVGQGDIAFGIEDEQPVLHRTDDGVQSVAFEANVGFASLEHVGGLLQPARTLFDGGGHQVERRGQLSDLVARAVLDTRREIAFADAARRVLQRRERFEQELPREQQHHQGQGDQRQAQVEELPEHGIDRHGEHSLVHGEVHLPAGPRDAAGETDLLGLVMVGCRRSRLRCEDQGQGVATRTAQRGTETGRPRKLERLTERGGPDVGAHDQLQVPEALTALDARNRRRQNEGGELKRRTGLRQRSDPRRFAIEGGRNGIRCGIGGQDEATVDVEQEGIDEGLDQRELVLAQMPDEFVPHRGGLAAVGHEPVADQTFELQPDVAVRGKVLHPAVEKFEGLLHDHVQEGGSFVEAQTDLPGQGFARGGGDDVAPETEGEQADEHERERELQADRNPG